MVSLKVFVKKDCPNCPKAKIVMKKLKKEGFNYIKEYNVETVDGLAEGAFHSVMSTPTILLVNSEEQSLAEWRGKVPLFDEIKREIAKAA